MKNKHLFLHGFIFVLIAVIAFSLTNNQSNPFDELKTKHHGFLRNSPFKQTKHLTKNERHALGIAPNAYKPIWSNISGPDFLGSISDVEFGTSEHEIYVTFYNYGIDNNIFYTLDGGATWVGKEGDFPDIPVRSIIANPLNEEEVIIGTDLGVWYTNNFSNANPSWLQAYNGMSNVKVNDLDVRDDNMVYAATYGRCVFSGQFTPESLLDDKILASCKSFITRSQSGDYDLHYLRNVPHIDINIFNLTGQLVESYKKVETENSDTIRLDKSVLSSGMYLIQIHEQSNTETLKWTIY